MFALAACRGVSPRPEGADASTLPAVTLSPDSQHDLLARVDEAIDAIVRRRIDEADTAARAALDIDPRCARARAALGMVLFQKAAVEDPPDLFLANAGERELRLALQLSPDDAFVGWAHARFLAESGHMSAAAAAAESALARAGQAPAAERAALLWSAGTYRYELGEERAALPHLQECVALLPDDSASCFRIGSCLLRLASVPLGPRPSSLQEAESRAEGAAQAFARCSELAPGDEDAALAVGAARVRAADLAAQRGDAAAAAKHRDAAEAQFRGVAERFPASAESLFRIGVLAEQQQQFDRAGEAYSQALLRDGEHLGSLLNLAALSERASIVGAPVQRELLQRALHVDAQRGGLTAAERKRIGDWLRGS